MPIHPLSCVVSRGGKIEYMIKEQIEIAFTHGLIPVLHGDIILDKKEGFRILSGDQLVVYVAKEFKARKVGMAVDVDGVLNGEGKTIKKITPEDLALGTMEIGSSEWIDVTGGMKEKVRLLAKLAAEDNIPSILFNGAKKSNIYKFLIDDKNLLGTVISL